MFGQAMSKDANYGGFRVGDSVVFSFDDNIHFGVVVIFDGPDWIGVRFKKPTEACHRLFGTLPGNTGYWLRKHRNSIKKAGRKYDLDVILGVI